MSQPGIKVIIRDIRGHLLHTVTFFVNLFVFQVCQRVVLLNLQGTKVNPKFLLFSERERERERERDSERDRERERASPKSSRESGGAMVLGKLSVPGHTNFR